ncbi:MAG TPA: IS3 family transposase [Bacillota bacterium]|nr:IS3 family transposase [Bacillota bacterium]
MYSQEEMNVALELYRQCGSVMKTIRQLGYPARITMHGWLEKEGFPKKPRKVREIINTQDHPLNPSAEVKLEALRRCFEQGESVKSVAEDIGYTKSSIFAWRKKYLREGAAALMNEKVIKRSPLKEGSTSSDKEIAELKAQLFDMQLEIDILKETITVLKKDPGADRTALKNREKAVIVGALKNRYSLPLLLKKMKLARSCWYYQQKALSRPDKYSVLRKSVKKLFKENKERYGYRRIWGLLLREGAQVSEKVVRRIMKQEELTVNIRRRRKYDSYQGEISPAPENVIERDFHADKPNRKWLTDITEFAIPAGKIYLSPIVDCFDGLLPSWTIGTHPDSGLVNTMLDEATAQLNADEHPVIHSDRGGHYRWPGWIERMEKAGLPRSMSKKGCSPDNSACEGFFGRVKNEMFYNRDWSGISIEEFKDTLNAYLLWYNEKRIKVSLGNMSPKEYRQSLGLAGY